MASAGGQTVSTTITVNVQTTRHGRPRLDGDPGRRRRGGLRRRGREWPGRPAQLDPDGDAERNAYRDATVSILYPYDGTVWPQGLLAPLLQWNPGAHAFDSVYVHIQENNYEYKGYFAVERDRRS